MGHSEHSHHECISGTIHEGKPIGVEETIHGLTTYVTGDRTNPKATIVMYSDVFGLNLPNNKLIADAYGRAGYYVLLPDFFKGDPMPLSMADLLIPVDARKQSMLGKYTGLLAKAPTFMSWSSRHKAATTDKICMFFLETLRHATPRSQKIGMVGFCWGGKYAIRAGQASNCTTIDGEDVPLVDAVVALHPSNLTLPDDVRDLIVPVSFGWGAEDSMVSIKTKAEVEKIHTQPQKSGKTIETEHRVYSPGRHGFGVRGNPDDPLEKKCLEDTEKQVLDWFSRWLL